LADGSEFYAPVVASNVDANVTFTRLLDPRILPPDFADAIGRISYDSASLKINVAVSELPDFRASPGVQAAPHHRGTIHICPDQDTIERAYDDAKYGRPSAQPILECTIPSVVDPSLAPAGKHLMSMFIQYAPYKLRGTTWDEEREPFADRCFDLLNEYAPNFKKSVIARQILTPLDLERTFGLTGGNIFQGAMPIHQLFFARPVPGFADYRTPIRGSSRWGRHGRRRRQCRARNAPQALMHLSPREWPHVVLANSRTILGRLDRRGGSGLRSAVDNRDDLLDLADKKGFQCRDRLVLVRHLSASRGTSGFPDLWMATCLPAVVAQAQTQTDLPKHTSHGPCRGPRSCTAGRES
jgi:hypothetical protein